MDMDPRPADVQDEINENVAPVDEQVNSSVDEQSHDAPALDEAPRAEQVVAEALAQGGPAPSGEPVDVNLFKSVYDDTLYFVDGMTEQYEFYPEILQALAGGNGTGRIQR